MPRRAKLSDLPSMPQLDWELRARLSQAFRRAKLSRIQIAEQLTPLVNRQITVGILNDYTTVKDRIRFPACYVVPLSDLLGCDPLEEFVLRPHRYRLLLLGNVVSQILDERIQELLLRSRRSR